MTTATPQSFYRRAPWRCAHETGARSTIAVFHPPTQAWVTVAATWATPLASAKEIAAFLVGAINDGAAMADLLDDARATLADMIADGVDFSSEQEAERIIAGSKRVV